MRLPVNTDTHYFSRPRTRNRRATSSATDFWFRGKFLSVGNRNSKCIRYSVVTMYRLSSSLVSFLLTFRQFASSLPCVGRPPRVIVVVDFLFQYSILGLLTDFVWYYKLVFGLVIVNTKDFFEFSTLTQTKCYRYKLFKKSNSRNIRTTFSVSVSWTYGTNSLPILIFLCLLNLNALSFLWTFLIIFSISSLDVNYCNYVFIVFLLYFTYILAHWFYFVLRAVVRALWPSCPAHALSFCHVICMLWSS